MRLFSAILPPEHVRRDVHVTLDTAPVGPRLRWTTVEKLHLTLVFLADVPPARLHEVIASVDAAASRVPAFEVELHGLGGFPALERARVLYVGVADGGDELRSLHAEQHGALPADLREDPFRPLHPHLTIARPRFPVPPAGIEELRRELAPWRWRFRAEEILLVESHLEARGTRYSVRHATGLRG